MRLIGIGFEKNDKDLNDFLIYPLILLVEISHALSFSTHYTHTRKPSLIHCKYWNGELYMDENRELYKAMNVKRFSPTELYGLTDKKAYSSLARAKAAGMRGSRWGGDPLYVSSFFFLLIRLILYLKRCIFYLCRF